MGKRGPKLKSDEQLRDSFWSRVDKDNFGGCWVWLGGKNPKGYGMVGSRGRYGPSYLCHRISLMYAGIHIPSGLCVDHVCEVKLCVNPEHLEIVTVEENTRRAGIRRRATQTHCGAGHPWNDQNTQWVRPRNDEGLPHRRCGACRRGEPATLGNDPATQ